MNVSLASTSWKSSTPRLARGPAVGGSPSKIDRSYLLLLASQLQGFCRDLHTEAATFVAAQSPSNTRTIVESSLTRDRKLDRGNASPSNVGSDFARLGIDFWPAVRQRSRRNEARQEQLNIWRNVIVHDSEAKPVGIRGTRPTLTYGRKLRRAAVMLAPHFDDVVRVEIEAIVGISPW